MTKEKIMPIREADNRMAELEWLWLPDWKKLVARSLPICFKLGREESEGIMWYLFWCDQCNRPAKDSSARGFRDPFDSPYLSCSYCGCSRDLFLPIFAVFVVLFRMIDAIAGKIARFFDKNDKDNDNSGNSSSSNQTGLW